MYQAEQAAAAEGLAPVQEEASGLNITIEEQAQKEETPTDSEVPTDRADAPPVDAEDLVAENEVRIMVV